LEKYLANFASENNNGIAHSFPGHFFFCQQKQELAASRGMKNAYRKMLKSLKQRY
jgi:hypothetical protein